MELIEIGNEGATLTFQVAEQLHGETLYVARLRDTQFTGEVVFSDFLVGSPGRLFVSLADNWRGWTGEMAWCEHEDRLALSAKSDGLGHVALTVTMRRQEPFSLLTSTVMLDAGQLERIAADMMALFGWR